MLSGASISSWSRSVGWTARRRGRCGDGIAVGWFWLGWRSSSCSRCRCSTSSRPLGDAPKPGDARASGDASRGGSTTAKRDAETRKLIVGREISLSGEIPACDRLVVEGSVEANLANCRDIDIAESGLFKGSAAIESAEIRGRFEGTRTVRKKLFIRSTAKAVGTVRYTQIEIDPVGQLSGAIHGFAAT